MATLMTKERSMEENRMDAKSKVISVSKGRQITLPIQYYRELGIIDEAECLLRDDEIVIRPVRRGDDFSEEILKDLVEQGYTGMELVEEFQRIRAGIRPAVKQMLHQAYKAAEEMEYSKSPEELLADLFGDDSDGQGD